MATPANSACFEASGLQRNQGIELSIHAQTIDGLRIIAGGSVIDALLRPQTNGLNEGNKVAGVSEYLINSNVEWDNPVMPALTLMCRNVPQAKGAYLFLGSTVDRMVAMHPTAWLIRSYERQFA